MPLAASHREAIISGCPLFRGLDAHGAAAIAAVATEVEFRPEHAIARQGELTEAELMETVFPHPTLSEMMHESVLAAYGRPLHI